MTNSDIGLPKWFWAVAVLAVVWNLLGVMAYLADVYQTSEDLEALSATVQRLYALRPAWAVAAFAVAVFAGLLGSVLLLLRKRLASAILLISLISILVQNVYWFGMAKAHTLFPASQQLMPFMVIVIAVLLIWFSRSSAQKGWLD